MVADRLDTLDDALARIRVTQLGVKWREGLLRGAPREIGLSDLRVLRAVERRLGAGRESSIRGVADELGVEHSTASRAVAAVERRGLLRRSSSPADRRRSRLELTDDGRVALDLVTRRRRMMVSQTVSEWPEDEVEQFVRLLDRFADHFHSLYGR